MREQKKKKKKVIYEFIDLSSCNNNKLQKGFNEYKKYENYFWGCEGKKKIKTRQSYDLQARLMFPKRRNRENTYRTERESKDELFI